MPVAQVQSRGTAGDRSMSPGDREPLQERPGIGHDGSVALADRMIRQG
jgi:hypothetical protein